MRQAKNFVAPVIRDRGGDLSKQWFVEFSFRNPDTGKHVRFRKFGRVNSLTTVEARMQRLLEVQAYWNEQIYERGFNPFGLSVGKIGLDKFPIDLALLEVIKEKSSYLRPTSLRNSRARITMFIKWLRKNGYNRLLPKEVRKAHIGEFLRSMSSDRKITNRTRNNYLVELNSAFAKLKELDFIPEDTANPCGTISRAPTRSQRHLIYTPTEMKRIQFWLEKNDPLLLLFVRHIIMGMRPLEIVELKLHQYDLDEYIIKVWAENEKTGQFKRKVIFEQFRKQFDEMELWKYPGSWYMFTSKGVPGKRRTTRRYFTQRFGKMKRELGFGDMHTMYGLRHTTIIDLVKQGVGHIDIMKFTGHKTLHAFQAYIQQYLDDDNVTDMGEKLSFKF